MKVLLRSLGRAALCSAAVLRATALTPEQVQQLPAAAVHPVDFSKEIKPILEARCANCHGYGRDKGNFRMDTRATFLKGGGSGEAVLVGKSAESYLIELVMGFDPDNVMPKKGTKLSRDQVGLLRAWIDQGLKWDETVSFAPKEPRNLTPRRPELPHDMPKQANPIDRLLAPYFATNGLTFGALVDDRVFARRVYLDVLGLLPTPAQLRDFTRNGNANQRRLLVRRLLADTENYSIHWLSFWNDLLRNDYKGTGYIDGGRKQITQWLYSALETNKPYNQFVAELISPVAGSEGFTKGIVWRGVVNASQTPPVQAAQNISQVFMGVNLKCASCHDSFINSWMLSDAYNLASVYAEDQLEQVECDKPTGKLATPRFIYPQLGDMLDRTNQSIRIYQLSQVITSRADGRLTRTLVNRLWQKFFGRGLVPTLDDMEQPAWHPDLLDWLAEEFADHGYDVKYLIELMLTSKAYQLPAVPVAEQGETKFVFRGPAVRRLTAEQFRDAVGSLTGVWYEKPNARIVHPDGETNRFALTRAALVTADPLQVALGRPNREQVVTERSPVATTLQALELTNGSDLATTLATGATNSLARSKGRPATAQLVNELYLKALSRAPTRTEASIARELVGAPPTADGVEDLAWALTMLPEFQLIY